jgi:hypothetical protein
LGIDKYQLSMNKWTVALAGMLVAASGCSRLEQARQSSHEASAIASLRVIISAQITYSATCGMYFAPSLRELGARPTSGEPFLSPDLKSDPVLRNGYTISMTPGPAATDSPASCNGVAAGRGVQSFFVTAVPDMRGGRHFATNGDGKVYVSSSSIPVTLTGPPPAPAVEVR